MRFLGKRLLLFVGALVGLSLLVFALLRILPGDVAAVVAGTNATAERLTSLRAQMGLDKSYAAQYGDWVLGLLHGDLGTSVVSGKAVSAQVSSRASVTFPLIVLSLLIALAIGLPLGCAAVLTRNVRLRGVFHAAAIVAGAIPALWGGLLLILLFSKGIGLMGLLPSQGFPDAGWAAPLSAMAALVLPALATGITAGASIMRYTRAAVGDMASSQAVAMAMACGMTRRQAVLRVALRLAIPVRASWPRFDAGHRRRQSGSDRGAERTVPAGGVFPVSGTAGRPAASHARSATEECDHWFG